MIHVTTIHLAIAAGASVTALIKVLHYKAQSLVLVQRETNGVAEAAGTAALRVSEVRDRAAFMRLEAEWNALVHATRDEPFYRHEWFRIWLDSFAPNARLRVMLAHDENNRLVAALPLVEERNLMMGVPVRSLASASNDHTPRFDLLAEDGVKAAEAFMEHLRRDGGWDVLHLNSVPPEGHAWRLYGTAVKDGNPTGTWQGDNSPYLDLPATHDEMQKRLDTKFKANLRRRHKKLAERGTVTVERVSGGPELAKYLEEGYAVESSGWKGRAHTAMSQDPQVARFYSELASFTAEEGSLALYFLRVDGKPVAFHYGLAYGSTYYLLKPGYDEDFKECSPGQLLMDEVVQSCIDGGLAGFDFLGPDMPWKRDWADQSRQHTWLYIFRDSLYGRFLHNHKFRWVPRAKQIAAKWAKK